MAYTSTIPPATQKAAPSPPAAGWNAPDPRWGLAHYVVKEKRFTLGRQYRVFDDQGRLVAFCRQKMFRLREDIRFYADESESVELFRLAAQKVIDFNANFAVIDSTTGVTIAFLRRKGWKSILKDEWLVLDARGMQVGSVQEDSGGMAFLRRVVTNLIPYNYRVMAAHGGAEHQMGEIQERFQVFGDTYDLRRNPQAPLDGRVLIGLTVCIDALEGE